MAETHAHEHAHDLVDITDCAFETRRSSSSSIEGFGVTQGYADLGALAFTLLDGDFIGQDKFFCFHTDAAADDNNMTVTVATLHSSFTNPYVLTTAGDFLWHRWLGAQQGGWWEVAKQLT